jgi:hypothetical protein
MTLGPSPIDWSYLMKKFVSMLSLTAALATAQLPSAHASAPPSCTQMTPAAFDSLIVSLRTSWQQASVDCDRFCTSGVYNVAALYNRDYLKLVLDNTIAFKKLVDDLGLSTPYITNASVSYGVHGLARDNMTSLHHARHWASISAIYHRSAFARASFDTTSTAIRQMEELGENGGRCYLDPYGPYTN